MFHKTAVLSVAARTRCSIVIMRFAKATSLSLCVWTRGGDLQDKSQLFDGSQVNSIVTPIYKDREKRIFEFGVRLDPPH